MNTKAVNLKSENTTKLVSYLTENQLDEFIRRIRIDGALVEEVSQNAKQALDNTGLNGWINTDCDEGLLSDFISKIASARWIPLAESIRPAVTDRDKYRVSCWFYQGMNIAIYANIGGVANIIGYTEAAVATLLGAVVAVAPVVPGTPTPPKDKSSQYKEVPLAVRLSETYHEEGVRGLFDELNYSESRMISTLRRASTDGVLINSWNDGQDTILLKKYNFQDLQLTVRSRIVGNQTIIEECKITDGRKTLSDETV
uniref:Propionicin-F n=2 Tax=Propionibacterium freudenreichii TaxID=1744 RepID=PRONF_PROFF|nr:RecName: Full=Propionicin-F; Flags: Precursor [Propionibacterium freudenreichii subsp. freudenreichii]AAT47515.1 propionicin F precursor [Propionibacterium freudenreichii]